MKEKLEDILKEGINKIEKAKSIEELQEIRRIILGKNSAISDVLKKIGGLSPDEKKEIGMEATKIKEEFTGKLNLKEKKLIEDKSVLEEPLDLTLPGKKVNAGVLHPITQMCYDLNDAFLSLGFEVFSEDEISSEKFVFDNLNFAPDHPARHVECCAVLKLR